MYSHIAGVDDSIEYIGHDGLSIRDELHNSYERPAYTNFPFQTPAIPPITFLHSPGVDHTEQLRNMTIHAVPASTSQFGMSNLLHNRAYNANTCTETIYTLPTHVQSAATTQAQISRGKTIEQIICAFISNVENELINTHVCTPVSANTPINRSLSINQQHKYRMLKSTLIFPSTDRSDELMQQVMRYTNRGRAFIREANDVMNDDTTKIFNTACKIDAYVEQVDGSICFTIEHLLISRSLHSINMYRQ